MLLDVTRDDKDLVQVFTTWVQTGHGQTKSVTFCVMEDHQNLCEIGFRAEDGVGPLHLECCCFLVTNSSLYGVLPGPGPSWLVIRFVLKKQILKDGSDRW